MTFPKASKTRLQVRQAIGYNLGSIIVSEVTSTGADSSSLLDTYGLAKGGNDEYNGSQIQINVPAGSIVAGEKSFVSDFDATNKDATVSPSFTAAPTDGDTYEMWLTKGGVRIEQVNDAINQAIIAATDDCLTDKVDETSLVKQDEIYEYEIPSGFVALHTVEYEYDLGIEHLLDDCEEAWTAGTSVTVTADSSFEKVGTYCNKLEVASGASANAILAYEDISSVDISDCDKVEFWMYSSIALTAGQLDFQLDSTAALGGTPLESIDIPAMTAATWYRHSLSLANPHSDTAIISIGIKQISDVGACTIYIDDVHAVKDRSRIYHVLNPEHWKITQGSTNYLQLDEVAHDAITDGYRLRLSGYQIPAELSADATACTVDPDYVIAKATAMLLASGAGGRDIDPDDRRGRADWWMGIAEKRLLQSRTGLEMNNRWIT